MPMRLGFILTIFVSAVFVCGCGLQPHSVTPVVKWPNPPTNDPGWSFNHASSFTWQGEPGRLVADIQRALNQLGFGMMLLVRDPVDDQKPLQAVQAKGLSDDGRVIYIYALPAQGKGDPKTPPPRQSSQSKLLFTVQVGAFGDVPMQQVIFKRLVKVMVGKPKPKRDNKFRLPAYPGTKPS